MSRRARRTEAAGAGGRRHGRASRRDGGVVALEVALTLPMVGLVLVGGLGLVGLVRTTLLVQDAAGLGARVAAVDRDDAAVRAAVRDVTGSPATVTVGPRPTAGIVRVEVTVPVEVLGLHRTVTARAAAAVEPGIDP